MHVTAFVTRYSNSKYSPDLVDLPDETRYGSDMGTDCVLQTVDSCPGRGTTSMSSAAVVSFMGRLKVPTVRLNACMDKENFVSRRKQHEKTKLFICHLLAR